MNSSSGVGTQDASAHLNPQLTLHQVHSQSAKNHLVEIELYATLIWGGIASLSLLKPECLPQKC